MPESGGGFRHPEDVDGAGLQGRDGRAEPADLAAAGVATVPVSSTAPFIVIDTLIWSSGMPSKRVRMS